MPKYRITAPDGGTYEVEAPEGASEQDVLTYAQSQFQGPTRSPLDIAADEEVKAARAERHPATTFISDTLSAASRGIPAIGSYMDELNAAISSGAHTLTGGTLGRPYDEALAYRRAQDRAADAEAPVASVIGQTAGGLLGAGPLVKAATIPSTLLGRVGAGAATGAASGGVYGYGLGEGSTQNRLDTARTGAKYGAGFGAALPLAGAAIAPVASKIGSALSPTLARIKDGPQAAAEKILADRLAKAGSSPAATRLELQRGQTEAATLGKGRAALAETIADTSDEMQRLAGSVYRTGGEAADVVKGALETRQRGPVNAFARQQQGPKGQMADIADAFDRALLIKSSGSAFKTDKALLAAQKAEGDKLYRAARKNSEPFDLNPVADDMRAVIADYTPTSSMGKKLNRALNLFSTSKKEFIPVADVRRFDAAKKELDDMIETAGRAGQGNLKRELTGLKDKLLVAVHQPDKLGAPTRNITYANARNSWGSAAENRDAIEKGRRALREDSDMTAEVFAGMSQGQQKLFRIGMRDAIKKSLGTKRASNNALLLFEQKRVQDLMREVIPRSRKGKFADRPDRFGKYLQRQGRMAETRNIALGGSPTARNIGDDLEMANDVLGNIYNRWRSSPTITNMAFEAVAAAGNKVFGFRQDVAVRLAKMLMEADPIKRNQILRRLQQQHSADKFRQFVDRLDNMSARVGIVAGQQATRAEVE